VAAITAALLLIQFALMLTAFIVLSNAIDWPASLDLPASEALPRVAENATAVAWGYGAYFTCSLLLVVLGALVRRAIGAQGAAGDLIVALAAASGFAKVLGLSRWLFLMPGLAASYVAPDATADSQAITAQLYDAFNAYAGAVGEMLGVCLLSGLWTAAVAVALWRTGRRGLGAAFALAAVLLLAGLPSGFGVDVGPVLMVSGLVWQFCLAALAVSLLRSGGGGSGSAPRA
jgi:hypothetical protein